MGTRGREIVGMDVEKLVELLNRAYASEWLAYYQYWLGAKVIKGPMKDAVAAELNLHATEELNHAVLLSGRIIQLGGTPVLDPKDWFSLSPCPYDAPNDPLVGTILSQNIAGEQCAISAYKGLMDATKDKDMVTYNLALTILQQEVEHEEDLQSLQEDLQLLIGRPADDRGPIMTTLKPGLVGRVTWEATERHSAETWGSGAVPVFATPSLVGLMETAAMQALSGQLDEGDTTVGTRIDVEHTAATPLGDRVSAEARLVSVDGRKLVFDIEARDSRQLIGRARHERVVVGRERFLARLTRT